jgi:hypothetical protein
MSLARPARPPRTRSPRRSRPATPAAPKEPDASPGSVLSPALGLIGAFGPPLTVLTGLLVYFGWARDDILYTWLGLDYTVIGTSTQEYVMRSVSILWLPLVVVTLAGIGWLLLHERAVAAIEAERIDGLRRVLRGLKFGVIVLPLAGFVATLPLPAWRELVLAFSFVVGILTTTYAALMQRRIRTTTGEREEATTLGRWHWSMLKLLIGGLVTLVLFWELSEFAGIVGRGYAQQIAHGLRDRTGVIVYSVKDLHVEAPGVTVTRYAGETSAYGYRYDGLKLLTKSGEKYYLLPVEWSRKDGKTIVLNDDSSVRLEFTTPASSR